MLRPSTLTICSASEPLRIAAAILLWLSVVVPAAAQSLITGPSKSAETIHRNTAIATFTKIGHNLTPCAASLSPPFEDFRGDGKHVWAARFRVIATAPGSWDLVVHSLDGAQEWRRPIVAVHGAADPSWTTDVFSEGKVRMTLEVSGQNAGPCPAVAFESELQISTPAQARGQFGNADDRWDEANSTLLARPDHALLAGWAEAVVHLEVLSPTGLLVPCTGYFLSPNILMTAAHCISTHAGALQSTVFLGPRRVTGSQLKLLMAQGPDLDFSLLWVQDAKSSVMLRLADKAAPALAVWQVPDDKKLVSIVECSTSTRDANELAHTCDTSGGSSGSPIQDRSTGDVVAVQTKGCTSTHKTTSCTNIGVRIDKVRDRIFSFEAELTALDPVAAGDLYSALRKP